MPFSVLAPTRYTLIVVRRQAALLTVLLACGAAWGGKAAPKKRPVAPPATAMRLDRNAAAKLGEAYAALRAGDLAAARRLAPTAGVVNKDYALYVAAQAAALEGDAAAALPKFRAVAAMKGSRFQ